MNKSAIIIENGTFLTKMGYAGNVEPDLVIPTAIADLEKKGTLISTKNDEYNYFIGYEAIIKSRESIKHKLIYPIQNGVIEDWDLMEKFWHQSIYNKLKCDPQEHYFVLIESPMNLPENRDKIAEIFFEIFNVPGLYIESQDLFTLYGCCFIFHYDSYGWKLPNKENTGVVIDCNEDVTHIVPICNEYVLESNIKHLPNDGRIINKFIEDMNRESEEKINLQDLYYETMDLKQKHGFINKEIMNNLESLIKKKDKNNFFKKFEGIGKISNQPFSIDIGNKIFLSPESFFSPEITLD